LVICPNCGSKLQYRKIFFLTNLNSVTCQACTARVRVKNKGTNSAIGALGGGLTGGIGALLLISWLFTKNPLYLGLLIPLLIVGVTIATILVERYIKVELDRPPTTFSQQVNPK
jgi:DNA-directed RNA polymerase subunit RPC12/RpoP